jgi:hypothetical protein
MVFLCFTVIQFPSKHLVFVFTEVTYHFSFKLFL